MKALLIIDMQKGSFSPYELKHDTFGVIERINKLSNHFRASNDQVVFIQHDGSKEGCFLPNSDEWELLPELTIEPSDLVVSKTANDAFYNTDLQLLLANDHITELVITGSATDFCVDSTIKAALSRDYNITVVEDAHTTGDRPFIDAVSLIKHYNWLWDDMTATRHKINVVDTNTLLK